MDDPQPLWPLTAGPDRLGHAGGRAMPPLGADQHDAPVAWIIAERPPSGAAPDARGSAPRGDHRPRHALGRPPGPSVVYAPLGLVSASGPSIREDRPFNLVAEKECLMANMWVPVRDSRNGGLSVPPDHAARAGHEA
jgi:hypothetical protein